MLSVHLIHLSGTGSKVLTQLLEGVKFQVGLDSVHFYNRNLLALLYREEIRCRQNDKNCLSVKYLIQSEHFDYTDNTEVNGQFVSVCFVFNLGVRSRLQQLVVIN